MTENEISQRIIATAISLHKSLGPGLLESVYETTLVYDLRESGIQVATQVSMPLIYKEVKLDIGYRLDLLVENKVIVEIKSIDKLAPIHFAQTLTYLKLAKKKLALLINFNTPLLKDGIHRIVNNLKTLCTWIKQHAKSAKNQFTKTPLRPLHKKLCDLCVKKFSTQSTQRNSPQNPSAILA